MASAWSQWCVILSILIQGVAIVGCSRASSVPTCELESSAFVRWQGQVFQLVVDMSLSTEDDQDVVLEHLRVVLSPSEKGESVIALARKCRRSGVGDSAVGESEAPDAGCELSVHSRFSARVEFDSAQVAHEYTAQCLAGPLYLLVMCERNGETMALGLFRVRQDVGGNASARTSAEWSNAVTGVTHQWWVEEGGTRIVIEKVRDYPIDTFVRERPDVLMSPFTRREQKWTPFHSR